jgi:DNA invertase Pin-like site-specific DNA recombinase
MGFDVLATYEDRAISGKNITEREGFQAALAKVLTMRDDGILVVYNMSRMARSTIDAINICNRLHKAHCDLAMITEQVDTSTPMGRYVFKMMAALAEFNREATSEETSLRLRHMQKNGIKVSRLPPYGWHEDPFNKKRLIPDSHEQGILDLILKLNTRDGLNAWDIQKELNRRNLKTRTGGEWGHSTIYKILYRHVTKDKQLIDIPRR